MGNKAITIGINHYNFLHPLKYVKHDALYVRDFCWERLDSSRFGISPTTRRR
jgi:hypothetical protein